MNKKGKKRHISCLCLILGLLYSVPLTLTYSAKNNGNSNLPISASIFASCQFTGGDVTLAFGTYDPLTSNATHSQDATTQFSMRCIKGTAAKVVINNGLNSLGGIRRMKSSGSYYLNYQLYTNASRTAIWDNSNSVTYTAHNPNPKSFKIYGRIPAGQDVGSGAYTDTVVMSVTF